MLRRWTIAPPPGSLLAHDLGNFFPETLGGIAIAGIVGRMMVADARNLLLERGKALELGIRDLGEMIGALGKLLGKRGKGAEAVDEIGELRLHVFGFSLRLDEGDALEGTLARDPRKQFCVRACFDRLA